MRKQLAAEEEIISWAVELGRRAKKGRAEQLIKMGLL